MTSESDIHDKFGPVSMISIWLLRLVPWWPLLNHLVNTNLRRKFFPNIIQGRKPSTRPIIKQQNFKARNSRKQKVQSVKI